MSYEQVTIELYITFSDLNFFKVKFFFNERVKAFNSNELLKFKLNSTPPVQNIRRKMSTKNE